VEASENPSIIDVIRSEAGWKKFFGKDLSSWAPWLAFLKAVYGLPMEPSEAEIWGQCTEREAPAGPYPVTYLASGRRSGKSTICGLVATYEALFGGHEPDSSVVVAAPVLKQAKIVFLSIKRFLSYFPSAVDKYSSDEILLKNGITISIRAADARHLRGTRIACAVVDEFAQFPEDQSELAVALEPAMGPTSKLIYSSTVFGKCGPLWEAFQAHFSYPSSSLFWKAGTATMNPLFPQGKIDKAVKADPLKMRAEYLSEFRDDLALLFSSDYPVRACCVGPAETPPDAVRHVAFLDASSGKADSMVLAVAKMFYGKAEVVAIREAKAPFTDPEKVLGDFCDTLRQYRISIVQSDRYSAAYVGHILGKKGVALETKVPPASDLYLSLYQHVLAGSVTLPDHEELKAQLLKLRRTLLPTGRERVGPPKGTHDDLANACAGAVHEVFKAVSEHQPAMPFVQRKPAVTIREERKAVLVESAQEMELDFQKYLEETEGGVCLPSKIGREYVVIRRRA